MATIDVFQLDTNNVMGLKFKNYLSEIRALSLTNPRQYFVLRKDISTKIIDVPVSNLYKSVFLCLTKGTAINGDALSTEVAYGTGAGALIPGYPSQKANIIALRLAEILEDELSKILETLMPLSFDNVASNTMSLATRSAMNNSTTIAPTGSGSSTASSNS